jgi:hypothetical protein
VKQEINKIFFICHAQCLYLDPVRNSLIPFGKLKIENYGSSAPLEECYIKATCRARYSHIDALQSLSNKTRPSNKRELMGVYRRLSYCFSMHATFLLNLLYESS